VLTPAEAKQYFEMTKGAGYYEVIMDDGTTRFFDIDLYATSFLPGTAYAKAYWTGDFEGKPFSKISENDYPIIKKLIEDDKRTRWVALDSPEELVELKNIMEDTKVKNFETEKVDGTTELYTIRYIDEEQERVS
ncbi:MAG: hypothetical protein ACREBU_12390, partial [Nitrososphaera sp.]